MVEGAIELKNVEQYGDKRNEDIKIVGNYKL